MQVTYFVTLLDSAGSGGGQDESCRLQATLPYLPYLPYCVGGKVQMGRYGVLCGNLFEAGQWLLFHQSSQQQHPPQEARAAPLSGTLRCKGVT